MHIATQIIYLKNCLLSIAGIDNKQKNQRGKINIRCFVKPSIFLFNYRIWGMALPKDNFKTPERGLDGSNCIPTDRSKGFFSWSK